MKFSFQQRDIPVAAVAFFLGVALTLLFLRRQKKEGWRGSSGHQVMAMKSYYTGTPEQVARDLGESALSRFLRSSQLNRIGRIAAIRVISTPGAWANHAQIETTFLNPILQQKRQRVYAFPLSQSLQGKWEAINHINPSAGPGTHLNGGNATNIVYTTSSGHKYVFVTLA